MGADFQVGMFDDLANEIDDVCEEIVLSNFNVTPVSFNNVRICHT